MKHKNIYILIIISIICTSSKNRLFIEDYCDIYGLVYFEENKNYAHALVYIEEDETISDLLVFKEDNRLFADEKGIWYITDNPSLANYRLHKVQEKRFADFSITYIEDRAFVGCQ